MNKLQKIICAGTLAFSLAKPANSQSLPPEEYVFQGKIDNNYVTFSSEEGCNLMTIFIYQNGIMTKQLELFDDENNDLKLDRVISYKNDEKIEFSKKDGGLGFRLFEMSFGYNLTMIEHLKKKN